MQNPIFLRLSFGIACLLNILLMPRSAFATHYMGADVTYTCAPAPNNNPCVYRILHKTYYDCRGAATTPLPGPSPQPSLNITSTCGMPTQIGGWVAVSYTEVTPICPDTSTACTDPFATLNGVTEQIYYGDFDFCSLPAGCVVTIGWTSCCRNNTITSLTNPGGDGMYLTTNITVGQNPCNNSPQFNFRPVPYICLGLPYTFNQGATDSDGDSLSYALVPCNSTTTPTPVSYGPGYSATAPLGPSATVILNPVTGDLTITPTTMQVGVICIQVTEWRNGVAINTVTRDMQVTVINCTGTPPTSTGINGSGVFDITACGGELVCFDIPVIGDTGRILTVSWNQNIPGGVFTSANGTQIDTVYGTTTATARFCWQTTPNMNGLYQFVVTAVDDNCPIRQQNQYSFQILVQQPTPITITGVTTICRGDSTTLNVLGGTSTWSWTPTTGVSNPNIRNPVLFPTQTTTYCVSSGGGDCPLVSECVTIVVNTPPVVTACNDTTLCTGTGGVPICANVTGGASPYIYVWSPNNGSLTNANTTNPIANPDSTTIYSFYAIGDDGCESNIDQLTVTVHPLPVVDAGPDLAFCDDSPGVFLQGSIVNPAGGYDVKWIPSTGLYCDTCLVTYAVPPANTIYTLYARSKVSGCQSDSTTVNPLSTMTVTVKPRPIVWAGRDTTICQGDSAQLYATVTGAGPNYSFDWKPLLGITQPTIINPKASPPHAVHYFVVATSDGCESEADTILVSVNPVPIVNAGPVRNICRGDSVLLPAHVQVGQTNSFQWTPSAGLNDPTLLQPMASPQTTTTYTLRAFTGICPSLPSDILVIVHDVPAPNAGSDTILCSNADSLIMQGAFTGGTAPYVTTWYPSTGLDATTIPNPKGLPNTSTMYYFTVSCGTGVSFCSATDSVLVTIKPGVFATLEADTNIICPGENVNLKAIGGQGSATFQWSPSTGLNNALTPYPVATPDTTTNYSVFISEGGCADTATVRIQVHPKPEAGFVQSQPSGCSPVMIQFNNRSANALSHTWSFGDGSPLNNELNPKHTYTQAGTYQVQLIVKGIGGCTDTLIGDLPVTITDRLVADFTSDPTSPVEMANPASEVFFRDKSIGASSWYWDFGDGKVANTQNPSHRYQAPGKYTVTLRAKNDAGCEGVVTKGPYVVFEPELFVPNVFSPNGDGVNDFFVLKYDGDESFHIQIYDRWGVKYFDTHNKTQHWNGQDLNGQAAAEGTYFYSVTVGNRSYSGTVNVMR